MMKHDILKFLVREHQKALILTKFIKKDPVKHKNLLKQIKRRATLTEQIIDKNLKPTMEFEENTLYPHIKGNDYEIDLMINECVEEHKMIRTLINRLESEFELERTLSKLGRLLEEHIFREEKLLFIKIEELFLDKLDELKFSDAI